MMRALHPVFEVGRPRPPASKLGDLLRQRASRFVAIGVCLYLGGLVLPIGIGWNGSLLFLASIGLLSVLFIPPTRCRKDTQLYNSVLVFLASVLASLLVSEDIGASTRLSTPLLPGILLFLLMAENFQDLKDVRSFFATFSVAGLGLGLHLLWTVWKNPGMQPLEWISEAGSDLLVVPNDVTLLAVIAPFSLALLFSGSAISVKVLAAFSLVVSILSVCLFQSRGATLVMFVAVGLASAIMRPRWALKLGLLTLILILLLDGLLGFQFAGKITSTANWTQRIPLWLTALSMFSKAPLLGHGPHLFALQYQYYLKTVTLPGWVLVENYPSSWAHNLFLETLCEQGILGFTAFSFMLCVALSSTRKAMSIPNAEARILGAGAMTSLLAFCIAATFELTLMRHWVILVLFGLLSIISCLSVRPLERKELSLC